jgi:transposase
VEKITTIGIDLAKNVFQVCGADASGSLLFNKKLRRSQVLQFFAEIPPCVVAMEACCSSHYWAREIAKLGHATKLIPPQYVKPFVKRQKNDATDAEAICEAAQRPTMRFVPGKSAEKHADTMLFRGRDLIVRQRSQLIHALRGHFAEFGIIAPAGPASVKKFRACLEEQQIDIPLMAQEILHLLLQQIDVLSEKIAMLDKAVKDRAKSDELAKRLMTIPSVGYVTAMALSAIAPPAETFRTARDFAAWVGLTPRQHSSGGKERLGKITKQGYRTLRRLLIIGASARVKAVVRFAAPASGWLTKILERKPRMLAIAALANKLARIAWALMARGGAYKAPAVYAA